MVFERAVGLEEEIALLVNRCEVDVRPKLLPDCRFARRVFLARTRCTFPMVGQFALLFEAKTETNRVCKQQLLFGRTFTNDLVSGCIVGAYSSVYLKNKT